MIRITIAVISLLLLHTPLYAKSALSPKHSGLDAPGQVRSMPMPGYTDAYGYGLTDKMPEEKKSRHRPRPGAYGGPPPSRDRAVNTLPEPAGPKSKPLWGF